MQALAFGSEAQLTRPCADCGLVTGGFCDFCLAAERFPGEEWAEGQQTPLCTVCDKKHGACHFCRGRLWCVPPPWRHASAPPSGPPSEK